MKAETADYLAKARQCLSDAQAIAGLAIHHVAAREAYLAAYHAAEAYLFELSGKAVKTHRGLRSEFARIARTEPRIEREHLTFLAQAYELKSIADYGTGAAARPITERDAAATIAAAARFIDAIARLLPPSP